MENAIVRKNGSNIEIRDLSQRDYQALFKCNIKGTINFIDDSNIVLDFIKLNDRGFNGTDNVINISTNVEENIVVGYGFLDDMFKELSKLGERVFILTEKEYIEKYPLIEIMEHLNSDLIEKSTVFDYNYNIFSMIGIPEPTGESNKLYYFELNDSVLVFSASGPSIHFEGYSSVMDILCQ